MLMTGYDIDTVLDIWFRDRVFLVNIEIMSGILTDYMNLEKIL